MGIYWIANIFPAEICCHDSKTIDVLRSFKTLREYFCAFAALLALGGAARPSQVHASRLPAQVRRHDPGRLAQSFQGSVTTGEASAQPIDLSLDDAIQRGLKNNLGVILSGTQTASARGAAAEPVAGAAAGRGFQRARRL